MNGFLDEPPAVFESHGDTYAAVARTSPFNRDYDRPTVVRLAGDLAGRRVLELGCAAGGLTEQLVAAGADVVAVDREPHLLELARQLVGERAQFHVVDLDEPVFDIAPASTDVVVASLVLHYVKNWAPLLRAVSEALIPGGALVCSLHHPITGWLLSDRTDYHRVELVSETWTWDTAAVTARLYRRSISAIFTALRDVGFVIDAVEEPRIDPAAADMSAEALNAINTQPLFLFIRAIRGGAY